MEKEKSSFSIESYIKQIKECQKTQLILLIAGGILFILGIILSPGLLKLIWLLLSGIVAVAGGVFYALPLIQQKKKS